MGKGQELYAGEEDSGEQREPQGGAVEQDIPEPGVHGEHSGVLCGKRKAPVLKQQRE